MSKPVRIHMSLATTYVGSKVSETVEIDREEWESMDETQREKYMDELYSQFISDNNYGGCSVEE